MQYIFSMTAELNMQPNINLPWTSQIFLIFASGILLVRNLPNTFLEIANHLIPLLFLHSVLLSFPLNGEQNHILLNFSNSILLNIKQMLVLPQENDIFLGPFGYANYILPFPSILIIFMFSF